MTENPKTPEPQQKHGIQFGLRELFIITVMVAVGMSLLTWPLVDYRREQAFLKSAGQQNVSIQSNTIWWFGSDFCAGILGTTIEERIWSVEFTSPPPEDFDLARLAELRSLRELSFANMPFDDDQLAFLSELENLEALDLSGTLATDAVLKSIEGLKKLEKLGTARTKVTYAALDRLQSKLPIAEDLCQRRANDELRKLGNITWNRSHIDQRDIFEARRNPKYPDNHIEQMMEKGFGGVLKLRLNRGTTKESLELMKYLDWLEEVEIHASQLNGEEMRYLAELDLKVLRLIEVRFNETGLTRLAELKTLEQLTLLDVEIAEDALERLRVALPKTQIEVLHETTQSASDP